MASTDTNRHLIRKDGNGTRDEAHCRVLVVDDDQLCLEIAGQMLEALGCRVDTAEGPVAAQQRLTRSRYDLLLTDLQMPHMDGIMLITWMKQRVKSTRAVIMTGNGQAVQSQYRNGGLADHWLPKPLDLSQLRGVLKGLPGY